MHLFNYYPSKSETDARLEKKIFKHSLIFPGFFVLCFWLILLVETTLDYDFTRLGIFPLHLKGLKGILFSPFIHSGFKHLIANTVPFFILSLALFYFYRKLAYRIFALVYIISGICVWMGGREAWHIGASGLVYGLGAFLFFSGIFRNDVRLLTIAIIVVFLYGGMFWGIFPIEPSISWESHLWGSISGLLLSIFYRKQGPQRTHFDWEDEHDEDDSDASNDASTGTGEFSANNNPANPEKTQQT